MVEGSGRNVVSLRRTVPTRAKSWEIVKREVVMPALRNVQSAMLDHGYNPEIVDLESGPGYPAVGLHWRTYGVLCDCTIASRVYWASDHLAVVLILTRISNGDYQYRVSDRQMYLYSEPTPSPSDIAFLLSMQVGQARQLDRDSKIPKDGWQPYLFI